MSESNDCPPKAYLLLENTQKSNNLGPLLRCAAAYGISTVIVIGFSKCSVEGSHGSSKYVEIVAYPTVTKAVASLRAKGVPTVIVGILGGLPIISSQNIIYTDSFQTYEDRVGGLVQISPDNNLQSEAEALQSRSFPVFIRPFDDGKDHCFVISKHKKGLTSSLAYLCDKFIHVPCIDMGHGLFDRPLLDVPCSLSIVLHHFSEWAGYDERTFDGHKFELNRNDIDKTNGPKQNSRDDLTREKERIEQEVVADDTLNVLGNLF